MGCKAHESRDDPREHEADHEAERGEHPAAREKARTVVARRAGCIGIVPVPARASQVAQAVANANAHAAISGPRARRGLRDAERIARGRRERLGDEHLREPQRRRTDEAGRDREQGSTRRTPFIPVS